MKPTPLQLDHIASGIHDPHGSRLTIARTIEEWEEVRPPDPELTALQEDHKIVWADRCRVQDKFNALIKEVMAKDQRIDALTAELAALIDVPDPAPTAEEIERAAFIAWAGPAGYDLSRGDSGGWLSVKTLCALHGWRGARNQTPQP